MAEATAPNEEAAAPGAQIDTTTGTGARGLPKTMTCRCGVEPDHQVCPSHVHQEVFEMTSRPSTAVFIDYDNHSLSRNLSESPIDSEFLAFLALVYWRFFGDSAFHKKLSLQQIPVSI